MRKSRKQVSPVSRVPAAKVAVAPPKARKRGALNPRQTRFVAEYLKDLNATQAYLRVYGGGHRQAQVAGSRLLSHVEVARRVEAGKARQLAKAELSAVRVLEEARRLALGNRVALMRCRTVADLEAMPEDVQALVSEFEVFNANIAGLQDGKTDRVRRVRTYGKAQALDLLFKHFRLTGEQNEGETVLEALFERLDRGRERNRQRKLERGG